MRGYTVVLINSIQHYVAGVWWCILFPPKGGKQLAYTMPIPRPWHTMKKV